jgi:hypothetical protein
MLPDTKLSAGGLSAFAEQRMALCIAVCGCLVVSAMIMPRMTGTAFVSVDILYLVSKILFWIFAAGVIFLPIRWAFLSLLLLMQVDVVAPEFVGTSSVGWENAVKVLVLPALVLWRVLPPESRRSIWTRSARFWMAFTCYVALAGIWSPYKLATAKMVGYLLCYFLLFWAFYWGWKRGYVDTGLVSLALWGTLGLACFQSFILGNPVDPWDGRFSSFCWPQAFGPGLVSVLALMLFREGRIRFRWAAVTGCLAALVMSGSRLAFFGSCSVFFAVWLHQTSKRRRELSLASLVKAVSGAGVTLLLLGAIVLYLAPANRLTELLLLGGREYQSAEDIGTVAARFMTYQAVLSELSDSGPLRLAVGAGTSTGGDIVVNNNLTTTVGYTHDDFVDPNRSLNSDFFKTIYEWGLSGLLLGLVLLSRLVRWVWQLVAKQKSAAGFALLGVLPMILLGLGEDNILTGAATPFGAGLVLLAAWALAEDRNYKPFDLIPAS